MTRSPTAITPSAAGQRRALAVGGAGGGGRWLHALAEGSHAAAGGGGGGGGGSGSGDGGGGGGGGRLMGVTLGQTMLERATASSGSKSSGDASGIGPVGRAAALDVGAQRNDRRDDVAAQERDRGAVDPVLGHQHQRRYEDRERQHAGDEHGRGAPVPNAGLGQVHGGDGPRDRGGDQHRQHVGRGLVLLAVERDDQLARRRWRPPPRPPSGPRPRRWPTEPGSAGARRRDPPRRAGPARWPSARSTRGPRRPTRRRSWRSGRRRR